MYAYPTHQVTHIAPPTPPESIHTLSLKGDQSSSSLASPTTASHSDNRSLFETYQVDLFTTYQSAHKEPLTAPESAKKFYNLAIFSGSDSFTMFSSISLDTESNFEDPAPGRSSPKGTDSQSSNKPEAAGDHDAEASGAMETPIASPVHSVAASVAGSVEEPAPRPSPPETALKRTIRRISSASVVGSIKSLFRRNRRSRSNSRDASLRRSGSTERSKNSKGGKDNKDSEKSSPASKNSKDKGKGKAPERASDESLIAGTTGNDRAPSRSRSADSEAPFIPIPAEEYDNGSFCDSLMALMGQNPRLSEYLDTSVMEQGDIAGTTRQKDKKNDEGKAKAEKKAEVPNSGLERSKSEVEKGKVKKSRSIFGRRS